MHAAPAANASYVVHPPESELGRREDADEARNNQQPHREAVPLQPGQWNRAIAVRVNQEELSVDRECCSHDQRSQASPESPAHANNAHLDEHQYTCRSSERECPQVLKVPRQSHKMGSFLSTRKIIAPQESEGAAGAT